jgi:cytochrome P450
MNTGKLPFEIKRLHDHYGPIVRVGVDEVSVNDAKAWKDIYNRKDMPRPPEYRALPPGVKAHSLISAPSEDHTRFRRALNPAFTEKATREYEPVVRQYCNKLASRIEEAGRKSGTIDLMEWINFTTFDLIGEIIWSRSYDCLETGTGHGFMGALLHFQAFLIATSIKYYPWLDSFLMAIIPKSAFKKLEEIFEDSHRRLNDRMESANPVHPDLVGYLQEYQGKAEHKDRLSEAEVEQNLLINIVGGSETLTSAITGAFNHLLSNPHLMKMLVTELRLSFKCEGEITALSLARLPYLNAVIDEGLRLCPPFPDMIRREVPASGTIIAGHALPPHTTVSLSCFTIFRAPEYFHDPDIFIPERWLDRRDGLKAKEAFHPFGVGPRGCLGQSLARMEMRMIMAHMLWRFNISVPHGEKLKRWESQKVYWTWEKEPLRVRLQTAKLD